MKRRYPLKLFLMMVALHFFLVHFYLFLPGVVLVLFGAISKPCLIIGLSLLAIDLVISIIKQLKLRKTALEESDNEEFNEFMDAAFASDDPNAFRDMLEERIQSGRAVGESDQAEHQEVLEKLTVYRILKGSIHDGMSLEEMVDAFAEMCNTSVGDPDDLLFETGNFNFTGEKLFHFSLVRQFQFLDPNEYVQLRLDVTYLPSLKTKFLYTTKWGATEGGFFEMVKSSRGFRVAQRLPIHTVTIRVEET